MLHYQIVAATIEMKGHNSYLHNEGGLDFEMQVSYHANEDNIGVERIIEPTTTTKAQKNYIIVNEDKRD